MHVHLVGSVPFSNAGEVFAKLGETLGSLAPRLPDGETGERLNWVGHLEKVFAASPALERSDEIFKIHPTAVGWHRYHLKKGRTIADLRFDNLFYADDAIRSYAVFFDLKTSGKILPGTRFQVALAPAHSVVWLFLADELHTPVDPIYNAALKQEIERTADAIPHGELAIQIDVASAVFARLERNEPSPYGRNKEEMQERFSSIVLDLANHVPGDVDLLLHLCYGDNNHRHVVDPTDMGDMVSFTNRISERISRTIQLVHMPVPRNRIDDAYFGPLRFLKLRPETELCLGLVHFTDGLDGTLRRVATARKFVTSFAIATECGFGRRDPKTIPELLRIHAAAATS